MTIIKQGYNSIPSSDKTAVDKVSIRFDALYDLQSVLKQSAILNKLTNLWIGMNESNITLGIFHIVHNLPKDDNTSSLPTHKFLTTTFKK